MISSLIGVNRERHLVVDGTWWVCTQRTGLRFGRTYRCSWCSWHDEANEYRQHKINTERRPFNREKKNIIQRQEPSGNDGGYELPANATHARRRTFTRSCTISGDGSLTRPRAGSLRTAKVQSNAAAFPKGRKNARRPLSLDKYSSCPSAGKQSLEGTQDHQLPSLTPPLRSLNLYEYSDHKDSFRSHTRPRIAPLDRGFTN